MVANKRLIVCDTVSAGGNKMKKEDSSQANLFSELSEYQISAREFFSTVLLDYLDKTFGWKKVLISYYDTQGQFLSWTYWRGILGDCDQHPYRQLLPHDVIRQTVFQDAVRDELTYFNTEPRLYQSTKIIPENDYEHSAYVEFIEENFKTHYSVTLAFGINAYIQVVLFKTLDQGDFTEAEMAKIKEVYVYLANSYKNFKKYEQAKIVQNIQNKIIASGEKAYLITDDFMHVMSYNQEAIECLKGILGATIAEQISSTTPCSWLPFLLGSEDEHDIKDGVRTRIIKNYEFKIYSYDQTYSNGIVDRYHWITVAKERKSDTVSTKAADSQLTNTEQKVVRLMCNGLTYKAIAAEMVISYHTVKKHVQNIYSKCGINSRFELYKLYNRE
ncbi:hypothetical protein FC07_GL001225 [Loigolactobacillus bifermentans DSM 20003]|uniref:HTH luxR-type domain-containing protein n=1 Tax=Loigolactobacillus bifermentans DSM 20003 TaxID=1423726 RepID=A0A0R1GGZ1_9LACO|nr:hypothetical protein FC07_GL001225 [Loigolactobacillus bifermentans DSM 20003]